MHSSTFLSPNSSTLSSSSASSSCTSSPFCPSESGADMDILDMPMSMLFPSEFSSTASSTPSSLFTNTAMTYPHNLLGVDRSQDELLLMHHHQQLLQLQNLEHQEQQQQELQLELAKIGLGTPPTSPFQMDVPLKHEDFTQQDTVLFNVLNSAPSTTRHHQLLPSSISHHSYYNNYPDGSSHSSLLTETSTSMRTYSGQAMEVGTIEGDLFPSNHITSSFPDSACSIVCSHFSNINNITGTSESFSLNSPTISQAIIKKESTSPTISSSNPTTMVTAERDSKISTGFTTSPTPFSSYPNFGEYEGSSESSSYSSSSDRANSQDCESNYPNSPLNSFSQDFQSPSPLLDSQSRHKTRPRSMFVSSSSMSSLFAQPYVSPFYNESSSISTSSSTGMTSQSRHDRRRSSSGTFTSSRTYSIDQFLNHNIQDNSGDQEQQQQQQQQRSQIQYHPQQQYFQHLLDPSMVPEITDIHVCPVCQRRFTRPFNLRSHIMTHTTARPFPCDQCHWKFTRQHDLLRHKRAKHPGSVPPLPPKTPKIKTES